jgi:hypothetical protein
LTRAIAGTQVLAVTLVSEMWAQETPWIELAFEGDFLGSGPFPESGGDWFALVRTGSGWDSVATRIEVTEIEEPICGDSASRITSLDIGDSLFLFRGSSEFEVGPLDSVVDSRRFFYPAESVSFQLESGRHFGFTAYGSATPSDEGIENYSMYLNREGRRQLIAEFPRIGLDGPPQLVWAGDLDHDGEPDALLDLARSYAGDLFVLFLSSPATQDQLVARVAEFPVSGC